MFSFSSTASITAESTLIGAVPRSDSTTVSTVGSMDMASSAAGAANAPPAASSPTAHRMVSLFIREPPG